MNLSLSELGAISRILSAAPGPGKALVRVLAVDVLESLGRNESMLQIGSERLRASHAGTTHEPGRYWAQLTHRTGETPVLRSLIKMPSLLPLLQNSELPLRELAALISHEKPAAALKERLLEWMQAPASKEQFTTATQLMLSLHAGVLTLPLYDERFYGFFQMKKRYNTRQKKTQIDFYAALEHLGPIEGTAMVAEGETHVRLEVAFESTRDHLEAASHTLSFGNNLRITLSREIAPLFEGSTRVLDLNA